MSEAPTISSVCSPEGLQRWRQKGRRLESESFSLEPLNETHLTSAYVAWLNDPEVTRYTRHGSAVYTLEKAHAYLKAIQASSTTVVFAIRRKLDGLHAGNISLNDISWSHCSGEISIILGERQCWGAGVGAEAVRLVTAFAFDVLDLHRVFVGMTVDNTGMIAVAQKNGFEQEGVLRQAFYKNGGYHDITQWYRLNPKHTKARE